MGLFNEKLDVLKRKATELAEENDLDGKLKKAKSTIESKAKEMNLDEKLDSARKTVQKTWAESSESLRSSSQERKDLKKPLDGAIERYEVTYKGGLPEYKDMKIKSGMALGINIMRDRFAITKTMATKDWFNDMDIYYNQIKDIHIEKRTISNTEWILGAGDSANQQQENVICILFERNGQKINVRLEMLTGGTIYKQATKCKEFMDTLMQEGILDSIKNDSSHKATNNSNDVLDQIKKLSELKDAGILSEEEFNSKKTELLSKL